MSLIERADGLLASYEGQIAGWALIFAIAMGFFTESGSTVTTIALGLSWILGSSYGRQQGYNRTGEDDQAESPTDGAEG